MSIKRHIEAELKLLFCKTKCLIFSCAGTLIFGLLTWFSSDGIGFAWRASRLPACSLPLFVIFVLSIVVYLLYGVLIALSFSYAVCTTLPIKALVSFVLLLFWCPLTLLAGIGIASFAAIIISSLYLIALGKTLIKRSVISLVCIAAVIAFQMYLLFFSVAFTIIN